MPNLTEAQIKERDLIDRAMKAKGVSWHALSKALGRNGAYIEQYYKKGSPRNLSTESKKIVARILDIPLKELLDNDLLHIDNISRDGGGYSGFSDDAESYDGPPGNIYAPALKEAQLAPFRIRTSVLDAIGIKPGDVRIFALSAKAVENVKTGDVVVCQAYDKNNLTKAKTLVRQYLAPSKLVANSTVTDHITIDMSKEDVHIKGVMMSE